MTHRLFVGPFAALEERFLAEVAALKGSDPLAPVDVLVGSNLLGVYLRRLVATRRGAVANLRLLTFVDLARETAGRMDSTELPPLPTLATLPLARAALLESHGAEVFGPLRSSRALARALAMLADDLASAGLSLRDLSLLPEAAGSAERRSFLAGLAATLKSFEASRAAFTTPHALFTAAGLAAGAPRQAGPLLVYGVSDLTGLHRALLAALGTSRDLVAFVPRTSADAPEVFPKVRQALFEELLEVSAVSADALDAAPFAQPSAVLAHDERDEGREVVREVIRAAADGIPLHRMAVLLRHPDSQEPGLLAELGRPGIPFFRPPGKGTAKSPLGRLALLLLALAEEDVPAPLLVETFDLLETEGLLGARAADLAETREKLEVLAGRTAWEARLARDTSTHHEAFETAFTRVVSALPSLEPAPLATWAARLDASLRALLGAHEGLPALLEAVRALRLAGEAVPGFRATVADAREALTEALDAIPVRTGAFERDGLNVLSLVSARGLLFDAVFLPGLVERGFPAPARPDPLLLDSERQELARRSGKPLAAKGGARHAGEERALFDLALASGRRRVVLFASRTDSVRDRDLLPSAFLVETLERLHARPLSARAIATESLSGLRRLAEGRVVQDGPARSAEEVWQRALDLRPGLLSRAERERPSVGSARTRAAARRSPLFTAYEGRLSRAPSNGPLDRQVSASRLELFAGCPYRLFLEKVLGLAEREETEEAFEADNLAKGNLLHDALASLVRSVPKGRSLTRLADPAHLSEEHAGKAAARWAERSGAARPPLFVELAASEVARAVRAVLDHESSRAHPERIPVAGAEVRFGPAFPAEDAEEESPLSTDAPLVIAGVAIGGRMDRLDFDKGGNRGLARVVDYKWSRNLTPFGGKDSEGRLVAGGERLQLAVYARAARVQGATEVVSEYLFVRPRDKTEDFEVVPVVFSAEETRRAESLLGDAIRALQSASREGLFLPRTQSARYPKDACKYCDMARVCGPTKTSVYRRKLRGDERGLGPLAELWALP